MTSPSFTFATYNLRKGGSDRNHWSTLLDHHGVDLLLVQESYSPDEHLPPLLNPKARSQAAWEPIPGHGYGSGVFAANGTVSKVPIPDFEGWVVGAEIQGLDGLPAQTDSIMAFSIHARKEGGSYVTAVGMVLDLIKSLSAGKEVVIGGDFNMTVSERHESEKPTAREDMVIQARLRDEFGLMNCWQEAHPNTPLHQTLRWTGDREYPYHCDGLFVPVAWKEHLCSCDVLNDAEWTERSDHNPVIARFGVPKVKDGELS